MSDDVIEFHNMIESKRIDETADYIARGRKHSELGDTELIEAWKASYLRLAETPRRKLGRVLALNNDLDSEMGLRGLSPPEDFMKTEAPRVGKKAVQRFKESILDDPDALHAIGAELMQELDEFRARKARSQS